MITKKTETKYYTSLGSGFDKLERAFAVEFNVPYGVAVDLVRRASEVIGALKLAAPEEPESGDWEWAKERLAEGKRVQSDAWPDCGWIETCEAGSYGGIVDEKGHRYTFGELSTVGTWTVVK